MSGPEIFLRCPTCNKLVKPSSGHGHHYEAKTWPKPDTQHHDDDCDDDYQSKVINRLNKLVTLGKKAEESDEIAITQREEIILLLKQLVPVAPAKATSLGGSIFAIHKGAPMAQVEKLDYKTDVEDALLTLAPDGPIDPPGATWTGVNNADGSDLGAALEVDPAGQHVRAIVRLPVDAATVDFTITATANVDNPATPEIESIASIFHIAGAHSLATDLGGGATDVAKGAGFP